MQAGFFPAGWPGLPGKQQEADTVVVLGGHRPQVQSSACFHAGCLRYPFGPIQADDETRSLLFDGLATEADRQADNTLKYICLLPLTVFRSQGSACTGSKRCKCCGLRSEAGRSCHENPARRILCAWIDRPYPLRPFLRLRARWTGAEGKAWARAADDRIIKAFLDFNEIEKP
jgi:hypothetical protein